ncbi:hypothetical protein H0H92_015556 [Tricholoma furcatifolium]|nr:hypothetical protein H0H92_015556 [Tricholoma furcatifolium]
MIIYALRSLLKSLTPLIEYELATGRAAPPGFSSSESSPSTASTPNPAPEISTLPATLDALIQSTAATHYAARMRARLGLRVADPTDEGRVWGPLLGMMERQGLDFHGTLRRLGGFRGRVVGADGGEGDADRDRDRVAQFVEMVVGPEKVSEAGWAREREGVVREWRAWLGVYEERLGRAGEVAAWVADADADADASTNDPESRREQAMRLANPRFVLRQWVLEEVIKRVERDAESGRRVLAKVMRMAASPFEAWGAEGDSYAGREVTREVTMTKEEEEERRLCGVGERRMLGFQCSCSS